jgi:16S rRNA (cytidine1402-2'-O)-methyltransferase
MLGTLYIVSTPIGNLEDITLRALRILKEADFIAAEDTRHTIKLLNHFEIHTPMFAYHQHNEQGMSDEILEILGKGKKVALVSDAGTPLISDPGYILVDKCLNSGARVVPIPGVCAGITALTVSGLNTERFHFVGFLPQKNKYRKKVFEEIKQSTETTIFYESPYRLTKLIALLVDEVGEHRKIVVARELTKKFEEVWRGNAGEALSHFMKKPVKGEIVILVDGLTKDECLKESKKKWACISVTDHVQWYIDKGLSEKDAMKKVAKDLGVGKREIYEQIKK